MLRRRSEPGGDQERAELVAVQAGGVGFVVQAGAVDMGGRGMVEEFFLNDRLNCVEGRTQCTLEVVPPGQKPR